MSFSRLSELIAKAYGSKAERQQADKELDAMFPAILDPAFRGEM